MKKTTDTQAYLARQACTIRADILRATTRARSGHPTSSLSCVEILTVLFMQIMRDNDHFILSKGHAAPALYAIYKALGYISDKQLMELRTFNSTLEGHPTPRFPFVQYATGSLGQGLGIAVGQLLGMEYKQERGRIYVLLGDAELSEGSIWEAAELAAYYQLGRLIAIVDGNRLGQTGETIAGYHLERHKKKFEAFGWKTHLVDGHNIEDLVAIFDSLPETDSQPTVIIAHTIKGYGVSIFENKEGWHGKTLSEEQLANALKELQQRCSSISEAHTNNASYHPQHIVHHQPQAPAIPAPQYQIGEQVSTRRAFGEVLVALGEVSLGEVSLGNASSAIVVLDAEVKNSTFTELFAKKFSNRFFQAFVAEQTMINMACGFAGAGLVPFAATFGAFFTRAHDQLRMASIGRLPLRLAGSHAGVSVGADGPSQMALEDIALFRSLPKSVVLYPCDAVSTHYLTQEMARYHDGISYLRLTRGDTPVMYDQKKTFTIGGCQVLRKSDHDVACIVAAGITVFEALAAHDILTSENIAVSVIDCYSIKPLPVASLQKAAQEAHNTLIVVEDHYPEGGICEAITHALGPDAFRIYGLSVERLPRSGTENELRSFENIDAPAIVRTVKTSIGKQ